MPIATTQSDFRKHIKDYLDRVNEDEQIVLVARSNQRTAAIISQNQLNALLDAVNAKEDSLDYAIARDKLIDMHVIQMILLLNPMTITGINSRIVRKSKSCLITLFGHAKHLMLI